MSLKSLVMILALFSSCAWAGDEALCLKLVEVDITQRSPQPVHFSDDSSRKDKITVRMNVDCKSGKILQPSSLSQTKDWLVLALPYDFKIGMMGGGTLNSYAYTQYGFSVEDDLDDYFTAQWNLNGNSAVCEEVAQKNTKQSPCFYKILESIRNEYKSPPLFSSP